MKGLEYFPLNCHMDDSVRLFEADTGLLGFAVLIKIWQSIYSGEGYFKLFDKDVCLLFATEIGEKADAVMNIINRAVERGLFNKELFEEHKILTSEGVQRRFFKCGERRKEIPVLKEYLLVSPDDFSNLFVCNLDENVNISKQSKVKKSKVKKSKEKESIDAPAPLTEELCFGEYKNVRLTKEKHQKLLETLGEGRLSRYIEKVDEYVQLSGKIYKDFYLVIKRWAREDGEEKSLPKKSRFVNYTDTNTHDYSDFQKKILEGMLSEED